MNPNDETSGRPALELSLNRIRTVKAIRLATAAGVTATVAEATSVDAARAWRNVLLKDPCPYCLGPGGTIDHVTPMSMGGSKDSIRNWSGACEACNIRRGSRALLYFLTDQDDPRAESRHAAIKALRRTHRTDIGPEVRAALKGVTGRDERRRAAQAIRDRHRNGRRDRRRRWKRAKKRLQRELVGWGQSALDDPTSRQSTRSASLGTMNAPEAAGATRSR